MTILSKLKALRIPLGVKIFLYPQKDKIEEYIKEERKEKEEDKNKLILTGYIKEGRCQK